MHTTRVSFSAFLIDTDYTMESVSRYTDWEEKMRALCQANQMEVLQQKIRDLEAKLKQYEPPKPAESCPRQPE